MLPEHSYDDFNVFMETLRELAAAGNVKLTAKRLKLVQNTLAERDPGAERVISGNYKLGKLAPDPFHGRYPATIGGKDHIVEYEPDSELRDTEQIPLQEPGGIEAFIRREVLPHAADAWVDDSKTEVGYEISFNRYFYKPQPLRPLDAIRADILALEKETEGLLARIVGPVAG